MVYIVTWQFVGDQTLVGNCRYFSDKETALETYKQFRQNKRVFKNVIMLEYNGINTSLDCMIQG